MKASFPRVLVPQKLLEPRGPQASTRPTGEAVNVLKASQVRVEIG
jgi:hypothetical protein